MKVTDELKVSKNLCIEKQHEKLVQDRIIRGNTMQGEWTETLAGDLFLLADTGPQDPNRILVFATEENLEELTKQDLLIADGTFSSVPHLFTQLYTMHGFVGNKCVPLIFALLPSKTEADYCNSLK